MLGAIYGDIAGSPYEPGTEYHENYNIPKDFPTFGPGCHFTDESLMNLAVAKALVDSKDDMDHYPDRLVAEMIRLARAHRNVAWGDAFYNWAYHGGDYPQPMNSSGNGAAMRIAPVGWVCDTLQQTIKLAEATTVVSHSHPEAIRGAEAVAVAVFLARNGASKDDIRSEVARYYPEIKKMTLKGLLAKKYGHDGTASWILAKGSVPQAICAFLESEDFESAVRNAILLNADADTQAAMAGAIAEAFYGMSPEQEGRAKSYLPEEYRDICAAFDAIKKPRK